MRVLVTGAAGFLGSHIAMKHLSVGDTVLGFDNFCSSNNESTHHNTLLKTPGYKFSNVDVTHLNNVRYVEWFSPQVIYNFACPASPPRYQAMPVETMLTCVVGLKNMLEIAKKYKSVLVQASTSEVYGDPAQGMTQQDESYRGCVNSYGPRACYDEGKRAGEALCYDYLTKHKVDARVVRIFNTYGPHMDPNDGRVVSNFINQALNGQDITVYGNGNQTRSFCYVDDLVEGIVAMGILSQNPNTPINLGNPVEFTMKQLAKIVTQKVGGSSKLTYKPLPVDDPKQRKPDIMLATKILGWEPDVDLGHGLNSTIQYFKELKGRNAL